MSVFAVVFSGVTVSAALAIRAPGRHTQFEWPRPEYCELVLRTGFKPLTGPA